MSALEIFLQFGTVFLGAFLAFGLENLRERRQLRAWANSYLKPVRDSLNPAPTLQFIESLEEIIKGYDDLIQQGKASDSFWKPLMAYAVSAAKSYSPLIDSSAITTLPVEIVSQLNSIEFHKQTDRQLSVICFDAYQQYTVPILLEEHSLSPTEKNGLQYVKQTFVNRVRWMKQGLELEHELLELLGKHNLGR